MNLTTHQVKEEETLHKIAIQYNMPLYNLCRLNGIEEDSFVTEGMTLQVKRGCRKQSI